MKDLIKTGDIFKCSWGYDQTNTDFYQVVRVISEKTIELRMIKSKQVDDHHVEPVVNDFTSEKFRRHPRYSNDRAYINGECSFMSASLWNGEPCYETAAGYGH